MYHPETHWTEKFKSRLDDKIQEWINIILEVDAITHATQRKHAAAKLQRYIDDFNNPPKVNIQFYETLKNLKRINCFSNEEDKWRKSRITFNDNFNLNINLEGKFITERGRINCSLREDNGFYRWLGIQFVIKEK